MQNISKYKTRMSAGTPFVQKDEMHLSHSKTKSGGSRVLACIIKTVQVYNIQINKNKKKTLSKAKPKL